MLINVLILYYYCKVLPKTYTPASIFSTVWSIVYLTTHQSPWPIDNCCYAFFSNVTYKGQTTSTSRIHEQKAYKGSNTENSLSLEFFTKTRQEDRQSSVPGTSDGRPTEFTALTLTGLLLNKKYIQYNTVSNVHTCTGTSQKIRKWWKRSFCW